MLPNPEQTQAVLDRPASCDASQQIKAIAAMVIDSIEDLLEAEDGGQIDEDTANEAIENILAEQLELQAEVMQLELEDIIEDAEQITIVGTPADTFGEALTMLLAEEHGSIEDAAAFVSEQTGIDAATIYDYANGDDMPDVDTAMAIGNCFAVCHDDPSAMQHLVSLASEMADYSADNRLNAEFAALRNERAEFSRKADIQHRLKQVERMADDLFQNNYITPDQRRRIMPQGLEADDRADFSAFFSHTATRLGTTPEQYLDNIEFTLNFLRNGGVQNFALTTDFSMYQEPEPLGSAEEAAIAAYRSTHGYS